VERASADVVPSTVFANLGSYTANWNSSNTDYNELDASVEASAEVQAQYESGLSSGVLMEDGATQRGLALVITESDELLFMAGDGSATLPSNGAAVVKQDLSSYPSGTYKFGWSASADTEQVALYIDGGVVDTGTYSRTYDDLTGGNAGGIKGQHGGGIRNLGQGWFSSTDYEYPLAIDWCAVYPGDITPDVQQTNSAPSADLTVTDDSSGDLVVEADATGSSDPDGDSLSYDYDWGDGRSDFNAGSTATHTYSQGGTYTVTVTVDDGNATDQASQDVTVSTSSSGSKVVHDFEGGDEGWVSVDTGIGRQSTYGRGGSTYSYGGSVSSTQYGELAYVEPPELNGGNKIKSFTFHFLEESTSYGGFVRLFDDSGASVIGAGTDNPQWDIYDSGGSFTQIYDGNSRYKDWIKVEMTFDWGAGTADVTFTNEATGTSRTEFGVPIGGNNVEKIQLSNYSSEDFSGGNIYMWIDDLSFVLPGSSDGTDGSPTGPSFDKTEATDYAYGNNLTYDIEWSGGAGPFQLRIYKTDSQTTLLHTATDLSGGSASDTNEMEESFGGSVYYVLEDANGKTAKASVDVEEFEFDYNYF
jgi:hypothetical protein